MFGPNFVVVFFESLYNVLDFVMLMNYSLLLFLPVIFFWWLRYILLLLKFVYFNIKVDCDFELRSHIYAEDFQDPQSWL